MRVKHEFQSSSPEEPGPEARQGLPRPPQERLPHRHGGGRAGGAICLPRPPHPEAGLPLSSGSRVSTRRPGLGVTYSKYRRPEEGERSTSTARCWPTSPSPTRRPLPPSPKRGLTARPASASIRRRGRRLEPARPSFVSGDPYVIDADRLNAAAGGAATSPARRRAAGSRTGQVKYLGKTGRAHRAAARRSARCRAERKSRGAASCHRAMRHSKRRWPGAPGQLARTRSSRRS